MEEKALFGVLGTAIGHGQPKPGVEKAYDHLERVGFWTELDDKYPYKNFGCLEQMAAEEAYNSLFHKTLEVINTGHRPLLIGGDHSQAFATVSALSNKYPDIRILWVDAHADMNTPDTSPSGNTHGMPLSGLMGLVDRDSWAMPWMNQMLRPNQVIHLGVRDMDPGELELMKKLNVEYYTPEAIQEKGLQNILDSIAKRWQGLPTHLSFDVDGLDHSLVPATGTPVGKGLDMDQAYAIITACKKQFDMVSAEVVEFNPDLAKNPEELQISEKNVRQLIKWILKPY